ncbi:Ribonuclease P protein subunit p29 [Phanerochaete sordida]|uniref:Ribonuclease P protein subunit n=1 Tax=Phanerochaete sordida TaxID=48140 RepID=A0A9P3GKB6_9APHY|nr:Ribonuclease P protein subunit p29 [Phanerochaete sordida]
MYYAGRSAVSTDIYTAPPPLSQRVKLSSETPFTPEYVKSNLSRSIDGAQVYASRVKGRQILLDQPVRENKLKKERDEKKARRAASRKRSDADVIANTTARRKGLHAGSPTERRFELFVAMHDLWMGYVSELLDLPPAESGSTKHAQTQAAGMHAKLIKAAFEGAMITVKQSKNASLVGLTGIVILETENAFKIVTPKDQLKLIPKRNSVFAFSVPLYRTPTPVSNPAASTPSPVPVEPCMTSQGPTPHTVLDLPRIELELYGNQFCFRAADRASRKFKHKETIEL